MSESLRITFMTGRHHFDGASCVACAVCRAPVATVADCYRHARCGVEAKRPGIWARLKKYLASPAQSCYTHDFNDHGAGL